MRIERTALQQDIEMITEDRSHSNYYGYDLFVKAGGTQVLALKMESFYLNRNYLNAYADEAIAIAYFVEDDVNKVLLPNPEDLEVIISRRTLPPPGATRDNWTSEGLVERYRGTMQDVTVPEIGESNSFDHDPKLTMKRVTFQLIDRAVYELRLTSIGGTYRATTAADVLNTVLTATSTSIELDAAVKPKGVDFYPADTQLKANGEPNIRQNVIIRNGVQIQDLAAYLQEHCGGIYNNGIGCFYQDQLWYVYPLYDNSRFNKSQRTLNIIRVPAEALPDVPSSYTFRGTHLYVLGTGDAIAVDPTNPTALNKGNATTFATATGLFDNYAPSEQQDAIIDSSQVMGKISIDKRADGLNATFYSERRVTDNIAKLISELSAARQTTMQFGWAHSDPSLIYPGMPVCVYYNKNGVIETKQGTVVAAESFVELAQPGMATRHYQCKTALTVLVADKPTNVV